MKYATEMQHAKRTSAYALLENGDYVGRIISNWNDNPLGVVCTSTVEFYGCCAFTGEYQCGTDNAGGYGYDKESSAVCLALQKIGHDVSFAGAGMSECEKWLNSNGIKLVKVL